MADDGWQGTKCIRRKSIETYLPMFPWKRSVIADVFKETYLKKKKKKDVLDIPQM